MNLSASLLALHSFETSIYPTKLSSFHLSSSSSAQILGLNHTDGQDLLFDSYFNHSLNQSTLRGKANYPEIVDGGGTYLFNHQSSSAPNFSQPAFALSPSGVNIASDDSLHSTHSNQHSNAHQFRHSVATFIDSTSSISTGAISRQDWLNQNIQDSSFRRTISSLFQDGVLDRTDMLKVFRQAEKSSTVSLKEFRDLTKLVSHARLFDMPDSVRVLSQKVVLGNSANQNYQETPLGNLHSGSSAIQLEKLVDKWFLGEDHPHDTFTDGTTIQYSLAQGSLFQNGIRFSDVKQGETGDCYFLAGLAAAAQHNRSAIQNMFTNNGDGTYTVRFYNKGVADYVTVDRYLPTWSDGTFIFANCEQKTANPSNALWVALAEKAYAQLHEEGWTGVDSGSSNSYVGISGGNCFRAIAQITGRHTDWDFTTNLSASTIINASNAGELITFDSNQSPTDSKIVGSHAYMLESYNPMTQKFTLFNPWGIRGGHEGSSFKPGQVKLTWSQIQSNFSYWDVTTA